MTKDETRSSQSTKCTKFVFVTIRIASTLTFVGKLPDKCVDKKLLRIVWKIYLIICSEDGRQSFC